ncbi:MAG: hypothetical protein WCA10_17475 [Terracidiphilus sp.]
MEPSKESPLNANEILHSEDPIKLTSEQIAKAVAHHNKRHSEVPGQNEQGKGQQVKKQGANRPK